MKKPHVWVVEKYVKGKFVPISFSLKFIAAKRMVNYLNKYGADFRVAKYVRTEK